MNLKLEREAFESRTMIPSAAPRIPYTVTLTHEGGMAEHFLIRAASPEEACEIAPRHSWFRRIPVATVSAEPGISFARFLMESRCSND